MPRILVQEWEESERGWGTRPDGFSIHLNDASLELFIQEYWSTMPKEVPDEYSRPAGPAVWCEVNQALYDTIVLNGIWVLRGKTVTDKTGQRTFIDYDLEIHQEAQAKQDLIDSIPSPS